MARICVLSSPDVTIVLLPIMYNIMIKHPTSQDLIHREPHKDGVLVLDEVLKTDEYDFETKDISKANALNSSLWEFTLLSNHIISKISSFIGSFKSNIKTFVKIDEYFGNSYDFIFNEEIKKKAKIGTPLEYNEPKKLFNSDLFSGWSS